MLKHHIVAGLIPEDGADVAKGLDEASAEGFQLLSTTCCALDEHNAYYIATFGIPVTEPKRGGIGMTGGGRRTPQPEQPNVDASTNPPSKNS